MNCKKCGNNNWGTWTSASTFRIHSYCKTCRQNRAVTYSSRKISATGKHSNKDWLDVLKSHHVCPACLRPWEEIPKRADKRYKFVWTKDHIIPLNKGGNDSIDNIQPLCYQCNFGKR